MAIHVILIIKPSFNQLNSRKQNKQNGTETFLRMLISSVCTHLKDAHFRCFCEIVPEINVCKVYDRWQSMRSLFEANECVKAGLLQQPVPGRTDYSPCTHADLPGQKCVEQVTCHEYMSALVVILRGDRPSPHCNSCTVM